MIGYLRGTLHQIEPDRVVLDVSGVGYLVRVPLSTYWPLERLGQGAEAELLIHTHVRDDALELFGFLEPQEKALFEKLIGVSGIGPRLAQGVLSGMPADDLIAALSAGDLARLTRIPGVGKKTAERMVLELRDAATKLAEAIGAEPAAPVSSTDQDVTAALVNLGYKAAAAERAVASVSAENPDAEFQEILRLALRPLARI